MHLRRVLLLMAVVLGAVAIVEALAPAPRERASNEAPAAPAPVPARAPVRTLQLRYPSERSVPRARVAPGARVVIEVATSAPGEASVVGLGLLETGAPATPARFDVLAARPGTYDITFDPTTGEPDAVGRLVVGEPG